MLNYIFRNVSVTFSNILKLNYISELFSSTILKKKPLKLAHVFLLGDQAFHFARKENRIRRRARFHHGHLPCRSSKLLLPFQYSEGLSGFIFQYTFD
jgi:hypothetical protein